MFSVYDPLALTIRDHGVLSETQVDRTGKNKDYRDQNTGSMETATANIGICTAAGMLLGYVLPKLLEMMMYG